ncbi:hypothetical protein C5E51_10920 [Nocardia nova]|uniref:hypothetical protein n=1 Tax=Nocardia nova TaxID=37330 RepID=UPI000CE9E7F9|nr:hypothetical protein [Nocardia nova]PPJ10758.1 hypothetical protein C5E51_10920 [Nocardia nova]
MASDVAAWVPVAVAGLGFAGVLGAQIIGSWREDRRWRRDRSRHEGDRRYQARQEAYALLLGAIEYWDTTVHPVWKALAAGAPPADDDLEKLRQAADDAAKVLGLAVLVSPERTRGLVREAMVPRWEYTALLVAGEATGEDLDQGWRKCQENYRTLRALMRDDLGFDAENDFMRMALTPPVNRAIGDG